MHSLWSDAQRAMVARLESNRSSGRDESMVLQSLGVLQLSTRDVLVGNDCFPRCTRACNSFHGGFGSASSINLRKHNLTEPAQCPIQCTTDDGFEAATPG
jgi:hypothetical protein